MSDRNLDLILVDKKLVGETGCDTIPLINMKATVTITWEEPEREIEPGDKIHWDQNPNVDYEVMAVDGDWLWLKVLRHDGATEVPVSLNIQGRKHQFTRII
jgi:hypothetical protein